MLEIALALSYTHFRDNGQNKNPTSLGSRRGILKVITCNKKTLCFRTFLKLFVRNKPRNNNNNNKMTHNRVVFINNLGSNFSKSFSNSRSCYIVHMHTTKSIFALKHFLNAPRDIVMQVVVLKHVILFIIMLQACCLQSIIIFVVTLHKSYI